MGPSKYAIGVDFGTLSGRVVLVDVADGRELASAVYEYADGVIDEFLPGTNIRLEPDWALQNPADYIDVFKTTIPHVLEQANLPTRAVLENEQADLQNLALLISQRPTLIRLLDEQDDFAFPDYF